MTSSASVFLLASTLAGASAMQIGLQARTASRCAPASCSVAWDRRSAVLGALSCGLLAAPGVAEAYDDYRCLCKTGY